jgi:hypothetical protein
MKLAGKPRVQSARRVLPAHLSIVLDFGTFTCLVPHTS